jgi:S-DNA-T family DNA segregation ATPase FtsK/SpoIIIE
MSEREIDEIVSFIASQAKPQYVQGVLSVSESATQAPQVQDDPLFAQALRIVVEAKQASVSLLQRRLPIGYSRAARLIDAMELKGYIGPYEGSKPREVKLTMGEYLRLFESQGQTDDIRPEPENGSGQAPGAYRR